MTNQAQATATAVIVPVYVPTAAEIATWGQIQSWIKTPPTASKVITITPWIAHQILDNLNTHNRPRKPGKIKVYAADMTADDWKLTGDTIKFTDRGRLGDGQNRLAACVQADVDFTTHVVFGIDDTVFAFLDRGKNRDGGDVLAIDGYSYSTQLSAAVKWCERLEHDPKGRQTLEPAAILELMRTKYGKGGLDEFVKEARKIYETTKHPVGLVAAILWHADKSDTRKANAFADAWAARGQPKRGGQGKQLAAMIKALDELAAVSSGRIHDTVRAAWAVMAWNAFVAGKRMTAKSYAWTPQDDFPDID